MYVDVLLAAQVRACVKLISYFCFLWAGGSPFYKQGSAEFSVKIRELKYFLTYKPYRLGRVLYFLLCYDTVCLASLWMVSRETKTHSKARGGCHVSTFSGRGVTLCLLLGRRITLK